MQKSSQFQLNNKANVCQQQQKRYLSIFTLYFLFCGFLLITCRQNVYTDTEFRYYMYMKSKRNIPLEVIKKDPLYGYRL